MGNTSRVVIATAYILSVLSIATSWRWCYVCTGVGEDRTCETAPNHVRHGPRAINCTSRYCTAVKVTYKKSGETQSFARLCEDLDRGNWCLHDPLYITCYTSCSSDFCNDGNPSHVILPEVDAAAAKKIFEEHTKMHLRRNSTKRAQSSKSRNADDAKYWKAGSGSHVYSTTSGSQDYVYGKTKPALSWQKDELAEAPFGLTSMKSGQQGVTLVQKQLLNLHPAATSVPMQIKAAGMAKSGSRDRVTSYTLIAHVVVSCLLEYILHTH